jgi:hypothetical protein
MTPPGEPDRMRTSPAAGIEESGVLTRRQQSCNVVECSFVKAIVALALSVISNPLLVYVGPFKRVVNDL